MTVTSHDFTGADGAAWPSPFVTNVATGALTAANIQSNKGRALVDGGSSAYDAYLQLLYGNDLRTDFEVTFKFTYTGSNCQWFIGRMQWTDPGGGYIVEFESGNVRLYEVSDTSPWTKGANVGTAVFAVASGTQYSVRYRMEGTTLSFRVWATAGAEPGPWTLQRTDATFTQGALTLNFDSPTSDSSNHQWDFDDFAYDDLVSGGSFSYVPMWTTDEWGVSQFSMRQVPTERGTGPAPTVSMVTTANAPGAPTTGGATGGGWLNLAPVSPPGGLSSVPSNTLFSGDSVNWDHREISGLWAAQPNTTAHITNSWIHSDTDCFRPFGAGTDWTVEDSYVEWDRPIASGGTHADLVQALLGSGPVIFRRCTFDGNSNEAGVYTSWGYDLSSRINSEWWGNELLFEDCWFTGDAGFHHWETNNGEIRFVRCKFSLSGLSSNYQDRGVSGTGSVTFTDCVFDNLSPIANVTLT